jgi:SAM-dependent methyltransferase
MTAPLTPAQARDYWSSRVTGDGSLANVGQVALGHYNCFTYPLRLEALDRALAGLVPAAPRVFDGGFGEGVYLDYWGRRGVAALAGVDLSPRAVAAARRRHPGFELRQGDLATAADLTGLGRFDVVTAVDVMYHIVDDQAWRDSVRNLLQLVAPGGVLVWSDKLPAEGASQPMAHVRRRSLELWRAQLAATEFEIVRRIPVFVLMDDPITNGAHPRLGAVARAQWRVTAGLIRRAGGWPGLQRALARGVASLQRPLERRLVRWLRKTPNLELIVCGRRAGTTQSAREGPWPASAW